MPIIEWDEDGYPTEESLKQLEKALKIGKTAEEWKRAVDVFYEALNENIYSDYWGPERVEVRGETKDVWGYHTGAGMVVMGYYQCAKKIIFLGGVR